MQKMYNGLENTSGYDMKQIMTTTICIAAPMKASGTTTISVNLAAALAALDQKTLLLDCDPRNRCLAAVVVDPLMDGPGLAQILLQDMNPEACLHPTRMEHLQILPAGRGLDSDAQGGGRGTCRRSR